MTIEEQDVARADRDDGFWMLPKRLRRGLREALDAGRGQLRMDPEVLAELLGKAIDLEVARLARLRREREQRLRIAAMLRGAEAYFAPTGTRGSGVGPRSETDDSRMTPDP